MPKFKMPNIFKKKIQATEGSQRGITQENLLFPSINSNNDNEYMSYGAQVINTYLKYNGQDTIGNWQTRAVIDTRTSFISGEGISIIAKNEKTAEFCEKFLRDNKLHGSRFYYLVQQSEMEGRCLLSLKADKEKIKMIRYLSQYCGGEEFKIYLKDKNDPDDILKVTIKTKDGQEKNITSKYVYVKTGGTFADINNTTTKTGLVLQNIDFYDRALQAMRSNNRLFAKVSPVFTCETQADVQRITALCTSRKWNVGDAIAMVNGKMELVVPNVGAMDNLKAEMLQNAKAISAVTGIPIHWLGHVDAMSNRSTAESLYETINNGTLVERNAWAEGIYELLIKAQELAIDSGLWEGFIDPDFEVKIPLIPFYKAYDNIKALSLAFNDRAISMQDYRNNLPGINPYMTGQMTEDDLKKAMDGIKVTQEEIMNGKNTSDKNNSAE